MVVAATGGYPVTFVAFAAASLAASVLADASLAGTEVSLPGRPATALDQCWTKGVPGGRQ